jgi:NADH-quinone oxidoreductase subunit C
MNFAEAIESIEKKFTVRGKSEFLGETTLLVERGEIAEFASYCKKDLGFDYLVDITSVDNSGADPRFEVVYELYRFREGDHLRLKLTVPEDDCEVPTVSGVWRTANWHEREIWDMMGISFAGHPDLRRILMWEGYPYFPLRKEFPLAGKSSNVDEVAFTNPAPLAGGPFVTIPTDKATRDREPRSREM